MTDMALMKRHAALRYAHRVKMRTLAVKAGALTADEAAQQVREALAQWRSLRTELTGERREIERRTMTARKLEAM